MTIPFAVMPHDQLAPGAYVEFDSTRSQQGPSLKTYRGLLIGQKVAAGSATPQAPYRVTSESQARSLFGAGSVLHRMFQLWFKQNTSSEAWAIPLNDAGGGVKATATVTVTGTATAAGSVYLYIGGRRIVAKVANGDVQNTIAAAIKAAIDAVTDHAVTTGIASNVVTLTHKNAGAFGNYLDLRTNFFQGEFSPAGVTVAVTAFSGGTTDPNLTDAFPAAANVQYDVICSPYTETANITALAAETEARWGPLSQIDGGAVCAREGSHAALLTFGGAANARFISFMGSDNLCGSQDEMAAAVAGAVLKSISIDPARPFRTIPLVGILGGTVVDQFDLTERDQLLKAGISTWRQDAGGTVRIDWVVSSYKTDPSGAPDISFRDFNNQFILSYFRYDIRTRWTLKYSQHKLAKDGTPFGAGQPIVTPQSAKAEILGYAMDWVRLGLLEDFDQFKQDLVAEINPLDPGRLDVWMQPNLVNGLRIAAFLVSFRV